MVHLRWQQGTCKVLDFDEPFVNLFPSYVHPHIRNRQYRVDGGLPIGRLRPYAGRFGQVVSQLPFVKTIGLHSLWKLRDREVHVNVVYTLDRDSSGKLCFWNATAQVCWDHPVLPDASYYVIGSSIPDLIAANSRALASSSASSSSSSSSSSSPSDPNSVQLPELPYVPASVEPVLSLIPPATGYTLSSSVL